MSKKRKFHIFSWCFFIFLFFKAFRSIDLIFWGFLFSLCSSIVFCTCCANRYSDFVQNLDLTAEVITKLSFDIREYFLDSFHFDSQLMSANLKMSVYHWSYSFIRRFTAWKSWLTLSYQEGPRPRVSNLEIWVIEQCVEETGSIIHCDTRITPRTSPIKCAWNKV